MRVLRRIMSYMLIVLMPVSMLCLAGNVTLRAPDVYQYSFKTAEILRNNDIYIGEDELGGLISDFMLHISGDGEFQINTDDEGDTLLFSKNDQRAMLSMRHFIDILLIIGGSSLILVVMFYVYFIKSDLKYILRVRFKSAVVVFAGMILAMGAICFIPSAADWAANFIFGGPMGENDAVPLLLGSGFARSYMLITYGASAILMVVAGYVTWRLTKPKRMFW